jgi:hypothetical protein
MATVDAFNIRTGPTTIDGVYLDGVIMFGLEKTAQMIFHAAHSTTLHTSVYNFHQRPLTGLRYESVLTNEKTMKLYRCFLLSFTCNN